MASSWALLRRTSLGFKLGPVDGCELGLPLGCDDCHVETLGLSLGVEAGIEGKSLGYRLGLLDGGSDSTAVLNSDINGSEDTWACRSASRWGTAQACRKS